MKSLLNHFKTHDSIIFDLDGCIYDEFDCVSSRYKTITIQLVEKEMQLVILEEMLSSWLEFGSSDNKLFKRMSAKYPDFTATQFEQKAVDIYRNDPLELQLSHRAFHILHKLKELNKALFLITDGNSVLQRIKFNALGLSRFFDEKNVVYTGDFGSEAYKPSPIAFQLLKDKINGRAIYVGDRETDEIFAANVGLNFMYVRNMLHGTR